MEIKTKDIEQFEEVITAVLQAMDAERGEKKGYSTTEAVTTIIKMTGGMDDDELS